MPKYFPPLLYVVFMFVSCFRDDSVRIRARSFDSTALGLAIETEWRKKRSKKEEWSRHTACCWMRMSAAYWVSSRGPNLSSSGYAFWRSCCLLLNGYVWEHELINAVRETTSVSLFFKHMYTHTNNLIHSLFILLSFSCLSAWLCVLS